MTTERHDLVLEIGVEELPARFCWPALRQLRDRATALLAAARLEHGEIVILGTPRRLTLFVHEMVERQTDRDTLVTGPAQQVAYDAAGRPTRAAEGFARAQGVSVDDLFVQNDDRGIAHVCARKFEPGQDAVAVLETLAPRLIGDLEFPQTMRWGSQAMRFGRPIRWLLCLYGDRPVHISIAGVESGTVTRGHRLLVSAAPIPVATAAGYRVACEQGLVMVDPDRRSETIWRQIQEVAAHLGGQVRGDDDLLDELTWLVEQPTAFEGSFSPAFLDLPAEVLVTSMREHQRYFPVYAVDGDALLPHFIAVSNGAADCLATIRRGNEKVLRARLSDARFFWDEDRRHRLEDRLELLKAVVFQQQLGNQYERVQRITALAVHIAGILGYDDQTSALVLRTAELCKCDLITQMVFEFPELQGKMGRAYALAQGEDPAVAAGIAEHYQPRGADDDVPRSPTGRAVGLADKLDTLAGFFGLGLIPTGSADPFALRRAAQGVIAIIAEHRLRLSPGPLIDAALAGYARFGDATRQRAAAELLQFMQARLEGMMKEHGLRYDIVDAVIAVGSDVVSALDRATALATSLNEPSFTAVAAAFKRIANMLSKDQSTKSATPNDVDGTLLTPPELVLWHAFTSLRAEAEAALEAEEYGQFYRLAAQLKDPVNTFFDEVLVMDPNPALRLNRLALLRQIARLLNRPADLSRLVIT